MQTRSKRKRVKLSPYFESKRYKSSVNCVSQTPPKPTRSKPLVKKCLKPQILTLPTPEDFSLAQAICSYGTQKQLVALYNYTAVVIVAW